MNNKKIPTTTGSNTDFSKKSYSQRNFPNFVAENSSALSSHPYWNFAARNVGIGALMILLILIIFPNFAYARPLTDAFTGGFANGLSQINNFFAGRQYEPYAKAIDFFFFAFLFIAVYMMGARYAFKEIKRPEQVIVILLGLMTAFLLVLADISAVILLPYIHWIFYILLFILYWWILKDMKSKFWRFVLALLLTVLTIGLAQVLFNYFTLPSVSGVRAPEAPSGIGGFFKDLFGSFKGIGIPGVSMPGVPDYMKGWLGGTTPAAPTGPTTLPSVVTPATPKEGHSWYFWPLIIILILLGGSGTIWGGRRLWKWWKGRGPKTDKDEIIKEINEIIGKKEEVREKIIKEQKKKNNILTAADEAQKHAAALLRADLANIWTDEGRNAIKEEDKWILEFVDEQKELVSGLVELNNVEEDLLKKIEVWKKFCAKNNVPDSERLIQVIIKNILLQNPQKNIEDTGISYLITLCYHYEKAEHYYGKKINEILEGKLENLLKTKFEPVNWNENRLKTLLNNETRVIDSIEDRIELQIEKLKVLLQKLGVTPTPSPSEEGETPETPPPTVHPDWPLPHTGKKDPNPPTKPVFPIKPKFPEPPKPPTKPTKHKKVFVDLSPWFMPIKNQNNAGACAAFAGTSILEYIRNRNLYERTEDIKLDQDLSELFLWYEVRDPADKGRNAGVYFLETVPINLKEKGDCYETIWPWEPLNPATSVPQNFAVEPIRPVAYADAASKKIVNYRTLNPNDPDSWADELLKELSEGKGNPILITIEVDRGFMDVGRSGATLYHQRSGAIEGLHVVAIVGFTTRFPDPKNPKKPIAAFKIRNSWSKGWGKYGYIWIPYYLLPTLLRDDPIVIDGWQKGEGQEIDVLTLKPTNSTPNGEIKIHSIHHDATDMKDNEAMAKVGLKIGKDNPKEKFPEINLVDTQINDKLQAVICYYKEHFGHHNVFKIFPMPLERVDVRIRLGEKWVALEPYEGGYVFPGWIENVNELQINEYIFAVKAAKEKVVIQPKEEYLKSFNDKNLKLISPQQVKNKIMFLIKLIKLLRSKDKDKFVKAKTLINETYSNEEDAKNRKGYTNLVEDIEKGTEEAIQKALRFLIQLRDNTNKTLDKYKNAKNISKTIREYLINLGILKIELDALIQELESKLKTGDETSVLIKFIKLLKENKFKEAKKIINDFYEDARNPLRLWCLNIQYNMQFNKLVEVVLRLRYLLYEINRSLYDKDIIYPEILELRKNPKEYVLLVDEINSLLNEIESKKLKKPTRGYKIPILVLQPTNSVREDNREAYPVYIISIYHRRKIVTIGDGNTFNINLKNSHTAGLQATIQAWDNNDDKTKKKEGYDPKKHGRWRFIIRHEQGNVIVDNTNLKDLEKNKFRVLSNGSKIKINGYEFEVLLFATDKEFVGNALELYMRQLRATLVLGQPKPGQRPKTKEKDLVLTVIPKDSNPKTPIKIVAPYAVGTKEAIIFGKGEDSDVKLQDSTSNHENQSIIYFDPNENKFTIGNLSEETKITLKYPVNISELKHGEEMELDDVTEITINNYSFDTRIAEEEIMDKNQYELQFRNLVLKKE